MAADADLNEPRHQPDGYSAAGSSTSTAPSTAPSTTARRAELDTPHTPHTSELAAITAALEQARRGIAGE